MQKQTESNLLKSKTWSVTSLKSPPWWCQSTRYTNKLSNKRCCRYQPSTHSSMASTSTTLTSSNATGQSYCVMRPTYAIGSTCGQWVTRLRVGKKTYPPNCSLLTNKPNKSWRRLKLCLKKVKKLNCTMEIKDSGRHCTVRVLIGALRLLIRGMEILISVQYCLD